MMEQSAVITPGPFQAHSVDPFSTSWGFLPPASDAAGGILWQLVGGSLPAAAAIKLLRHQHGHSLFSKGEKLITDHLNLWIEFSSVSQRETQWRRENTFLLQSQNQNHRNRFYTGWPGNSSRGSDRYRFFWLRQKCFLYWWKLWLKFTIKPPDGNSKELLWLTSRVSVEAGPAFEGSVMKRGVCCLERWTPGGDELGC